MVEVGFTVEGWRAAWSVHTLSRGKCLVPTVSPGFDRAHVLQSATSGEQGLGEVHALAQKPRWLQQSLWAAGEARIDTWNDFYEATFAEPSVSEGFAYLKAVESAVAERRG